jgi:hypothetical protein
METCSSETSVGFQRTILRYIREDRTLYNHRCENLSSYKFFIFLLFIMDIKLNLSLREEERFCREYFDLEGRKLQGDNFIIETLRQILLD